LVGEGELKHAMLPAQDADCSLDVNNLVEHKCESALAVAAWNTQHDWPTRHTVSEVLNCSQLADKLALTSVAMSYLNENKSLYVFDAVQRS
jgi:hypothetical protein